MLNRVPPLAVLAAALVSGAVLLGLGPLGSAPAQAQGAPERPKVVVELFTSQGCSSCPPADAVFLGLAKQPGMIALTFPVTYWDYLGWKDTLGHEAFTKRQKLYAKARGDGQVYTPQAVVNGTEHFVGSDRAAIDKALARRAPGLIVAVTLTEARGELKIALTQAEVPGGGAAGVYLLPMLRHATVAIGRGENRGRSVSYANVVRGLVRVGDWDGKPATLTAPLALSKTEDSDSYAVLVQTEPAGRYGAMPGAIIGAAMAR